MRQLEEGHVLNVRAIGGLHVVTLAWDFAAGQEDRRKGFGLDYDATQQREAWFAACPRPALVGQSFKIKNADLGQLTPIHFSLT
jgi:hypothetical protein